MLATRPDIDTIAITRTFDGIGAATHRIISQMGGMTSVLRETKIAVLKPNFVAGRSAITGSTTSFALLKAVAEEVRACGTEPVLCVIPGVDMNRGIKPDLTIVDGSVGQDGEGPLYSGARGLS